MTSEVTKCPKSAKSDRNSDVLLKAVERGRENLLQCINEMCAWISGWKLLVRNDAQ